MSDEPRRAADEADFTFRAAALTAEELKVTAFTGHEGISELFEFDVRLCGRDPEIDLEAVVGKSCSLAIATSAGIRHLNGIVRRFARSGESPREEGGTARNTIYRAEVVPSHWLLTKRYKSRIFQAHNCADMTVPGIIRKVLEDAGVPEDMFRFALEYQGYPVRDFVVQYRESDMDFISRLMEHEGIFYFFEHTAEGHAMVFGDSGVASAVNPVGESFPFREPSGLVEETEYVFGASEQSAINFGAVCLDEYDFKRPTTELRSTIQADQYASLEFSDYPGEYPEASDGKRCAQVRLEEHQCTRYTADLSATVRGLTPGYRFTLVEHPAEPMNREYLVTRITHEAAQPQSGEEDAAAGQGPSYQSEIRAIASDVPFRPARVTRKPVIVGSQTALVTGPSGEEIYTDNDGYGRVKVQFHWDLQGGHDENSSCWIRVSQGWSGGNYGMIFLPRVGQEVIVDFLEGNPDRPIITGRVYNNDNMPPYALPDEKTKSTIKSRSSTGGGGFNELRFEDKKDSEQIFMHAQKSLDLRVRADERDYVGNDRHVKVHRDQKQEIERDEHRIVGQDQLIKITRDRSTTVEGNDARSVGGSLSLTVSGDAAESYQARHSIEVAQSCTIKALEVVIDASAGITLKCGGSFVKVDPSGVAIDGPLVLIKSGGSAGAPSVVSAAAPAEPEEPDLAATGDPGTDYTYQNEKKQYDPLAPAPWHDEATEDEEKHWIGIRMFDDNGEPLGGERYQVVLPDGTTVARGRLDQNGEAEIRGIDPGSCEITFPELDAETWQPGPPAGGEGGEDGAVEVGGNGVDVGGD